MKSEYVYLGDRMTRAELRGKKCRAIRRPDGKCICGRNATMLVEFEDGQRVIVLRRRLRRTKATADSFEETGPFGTLEGRIHIAVGNQRPATVKRIKSAAEKESEG